MFWSLPSGHRLPVRVVGSVLGPPVPSVPRETVVIFTCLTALLLVLAVAAVCAPDIVRKAAPQCSKDTALSLERRRPARSLPTSTPRTPALAPVLVVDADAGIRDLLHDLLGEAGYAVASHSTSADALAYLRAAHTRHVVLLDYLLPQERATRLLSVVLREEALQRHHYVLLSTVPLEFLPAEEQRLIAATCTTIVRKPFAIDTLLQAVAQAGGAFAQVHLQQLAEHVA